MTPPPAPADDPSGSELDALEQELHNLSHEHARLRGELEERFQRVRAVEERFLSMRPDAGTEVQHELKRRMVLSRPWREELDQAYQGLLATTNQIGAVTRRIHEVQLRAAQLAAASGGPHFSSPPTPAQG
ncbi:MAG: hypothetical protein KGJ23_05990 [Euryarchaeota archaeon]|nr:hypothetical protein [Euryarchaeota archaeon]MDE1836149.1 hypothetical protein [Euryarchaeota archaeon]MDE2044127.1 hypothetical protein [Thermoplasmata archaeon]